VAEDSDRIDLSSRKDVEAFLRREPRAWAEVLAARAALRVVPLLASFVSEGPPSPSRFAPSNVFLTLFRSTALPWLAALVPRHGRRLRKAARSAASAAGVAAWVPIGARFAATAAANAANAAAARSAAAAAAAAASAAANAAAAASTAAAASAASTAPAARSVIYDALSRDGARLVVHGQADNLRSIPLWGALGVPDFVAHNWARLSTALRQAEGAADWSLVWIDWYEALSQGHAPWGLPREIGEQILVEAMLWPQSEWDEGALHINRRIAGLIEAAQVAENGGLSVIVPKPIPSRRDPLPPLPQPLEALDPISHDFFVSYCHVDETLAREVVDVVEGLGFSAFAQFRDMGPGSNFVREMQRGLATSSRVVALYSPEYEASHQCQAEWSTAYNADPGGEKRKLLPFLLRPTRLNPLAQQIVYKSLVGLSVAERRAAIIDAIEHRSGASTTRAAVDALAAASSPDVMVTAAGRLDVAPNLTFDRVVSASSLPDLPKRQRILCRQIIEHVPGNTPPMFTACFKVYGRHLNQAVSEIVPGVLDDQWQTAGAYLVGDEAIVLDAGLTRTLAIFAENHAEIVAHFPLREDRERLLSETPIDEETAAGEALTNPIENVRQAVEAAAEADQVTPALVEHVADLSDRAEALAPPTTSVGRESTTTITPRRRLVLTSLGFFERLYAAIGSTASVLSTETGRALYNAAREAADALMRFIR
jgi:hypothetical protein